MANVANNMQIRESGMVNEQRPLMEIEEMISIDIDARRQIAEQYNLRAATMEDLEAAFELRKRIEAIDDEEQVSKIESPLDGREICELLGIQPGPLVGKYKASLLDAVISGELQNDKAVATEYLQNLHSGDSGFD